MKTIALLLCLFATICLAQAQQTVVSGKVTDSETGEGMPFVNVFFKGTTIGTTTDFDGFYTLTTEKPTDSLLVSYIGYKTRAKFVQKATKQTINFQLLPDAINLREVVITEKWENPAWEILRGVMDNKSKNNPIKLEAYQYESYSKMELDVDNISEKFKKKKIIKKIQSVLDSIEQIAGEDGKPILPVFISEAVSNYYYRRFPEKKREEIIKTKVSGIGVTDGSVVSQVIGSTFVNYNFYKNWLSIGGKEFVSPIAESWRVLYDYDLEKFSEKVDGFNCYRISFKPKNPLDLAFSGTMWITDSAYALKQIDVKVDKTANLNFIEKIKIQQEYAPVQENGAWLPAKTRILIDIGDIKDDWAGMLAKSYTSNKNFVINQPKELKFYEQPIALAKDALTKDEIFWQNRRHDSLSSTEKNVYLMIDTIKKLPVIRNWVEIVNIAFNGYKSVGKVDIGPYAYLYANNTLEGNRFRLGFKTNYSFSKKLILRGYGAYGTLDRRFKYGAGFDYILSRRYWTQFGLWRSDDLGQVALMSEAFQNTSNTLFRASAFWFNMENRRPFIHQVNRFYFKTDIAKGVTQKITFSHQNFKPLFAFEYIDVDNDKLRRSDFSTAEVAAEMRIAFKENYIENENSRIIINSKYPVITLRGVMGFKTLLGGDFNYQKITASISQYVRLGVLGTGDYSIMAGYIPSRVPYMLLEPHLGNQTFVLNENSYNLMQFFEFVSDRYVSFDYTHRFEGLFFNRVPLLKKMKLRALATAKVLYGSLSKENLNFLPTNTLAGEPILGFKGLGNTPYVEVGYGVENIFRFIRVDFLHRLTYLESPTTKAFGVKVTAQFRL